MFVDLFCLFTLLLHNHIVFSTYGEIGWNPCYFIDIKHKDRTAQRFVCSEYKHSYLFPCEQDERMCVSRGP